MTRDDLAFAVAGILRDWIHTTPMSECGTWADTCPDWPLAFEIRDKIMPAFDAQLESILEFLREEAEKAGDLRHARRQNDPQGAALFYDGRYHAMHDAFNFVLKRKENHAASNPK